MVLLHQAFCDLKCKADESIARPVADYVFHACNLPRNVAKSREVFCNSQRNFALRRKLRKEGVTEITYKINSFTCLPCECPILGIGY